ncbi:50S ribosomal protein L4 [Candidatus Mycoplasma haematohominis]|uniref:Large ribosomal subunit protein uL4 n=1 Tax=Candidatus Mycoplasma haematohominis TaxID=1494318 RepID=A0A478FUH1_9MOLU|nr:50S ribosomal protein L4 [Candidatus Mycoplasma haemohominis]
MKKIKVIDKEGKFGKEQEVPETVITPKRINRHTIFETVNAENQNRRQGTHDTKNKSEVSGTGKKPYKQKHTGRARQGSKRNPHYTGGGIAFGPTPEKNYTVKVNKKVSKIAYITSWFSIIESENICILNDSVCSISYKTKEFNQFLKKANLLDKKILLITNMDEKSFSSSTRNIRNVILRSPNNCSVRDLLNQDYLLVTNKAIDEIYKKLETWK